MSTEHLTNKILWRGGLPPGLDLVLNTGYPDLSWVFSVHPGNISRTPKLLRLGELFTYRVYFSGRVFHESVGIGRTTSYSFDKAMSNIYSLEMLGFSVDTTRWHRGNKKCAKSVTAWEILGTVQGSMWCLNLVNLRDILISWNSC